MTVVAIDTHAVVVKALKAAGFTGDQAEAVTRAVRQAQEADVLNLATRVDLAEAKAEILKWIAGAIGIQTIVHYWGADHAAAPGGALIRC